MMRMGKIFRCWLLTAPRSQARRQSRAECGKWSSHVLPAIGVEAGTGDIPRSIVGEKCYAARHFLGRAKAADGNEWQDLGIEDFLWHCPHHLRGDVARGDDVDGDASRGCLLRHRLAEAQQRRLGG